MNTLLLRQLRKFTGSENVPSDLTLLFNAISDAYDQNDEDRSLSDRTLEISSKELLDSNNELKKALEKVQETQIRLIHSEKMAGLGQLIAGVAHEINTPASAIFHSIDGIQSNFLKILENIILIVKNFNHTSIEEFLSLYNKVIHFNKKLDTQKCREAARMMENVLVENNIDNARNVSSNLAIIGFTKNEIPDFINFIKGNHEWQICYQTLHKLGMVEIHVDDIRIAIDRIINIVKALKVYCRVEQNEILLTDLQEDINNTLTILHNKIKRGVTIKKEFQEIPKIKCYPDQLNQVWTNLINNAIEAMKGTGVIIIRIKLDKPSIIVEIEDNGPGIPKEILPRIFEPYFTTKPKGEGTGLGLSISMEIIEKHQGKIEIQTEVGKTLFRVFLPIDIKTNLEKKHA